MATSRSNLPKEMTSFKSKKALPFGAKKATFFGVPPPDSEKGKKTMKEMKKKKNPFAFAKGGNISADDQPSSRMAAPANNPPSHNKLDDGKPSDGGTMKSMGAAKRGGKFRGTF